MAFHPKYIAMAVPLVLPLVLAGTVLHAWRSGLRGPRMTAAWAAQFYGYVLVVTLGAHTLEVAYNWGRGRSVVGETPLAYDWRVYSLLLFGILLVWQGVACVRAARRLYAGDGSAGPDVLRTIAIVLAIVLPTIPMDAFLGLLMSGASVFTAVLVARSMLSRTPAGAAPRAAGAPPAASVGFVAGIRQDARADPGAASHAGASADQA